MADSNDYTELIAGAHVEKEKFQQFVYELTQPFVTAQRRLEQMITDFDLDTAVGKQLDALGVRIGLGRLLKLRITDTFFALDDVDGYGLDLGVWIQPLDDVYGVLEMDDEIYRNALKSKVLFNQCNGTNEAVIRSIVETFNNFNAGTSTLKYSDEQDMTAWIQWNYAKTPDILSKLLNQEIINFRTVGVGLEFSDSNRTADLCASNGDSLFASNGDGIYVIYQDIRED